MKVTNILLAVLFSMCLAACQGQYCLDTEGQCTEWVAASAGDAVCETPLQDGACPGEYAAACDNGDGSTTKLESSDCGDAGTVDEDACIAGGGVFECLVVNCDPVEPTVECGEVVIDTCGTTEVLECPEGEVCTDGVCEEEVVCDPVEPTAECGEVVIDTCGNTEILGCAEGLICNDGVCEEPPCDPVEPSAECGVIVVDTCGNTADIPCTGAGEVCVGGACICEAVTPTEECGEVVIDSCGNTDVLECSGAGEVCDDGVCVCEAITPAAECGEVVIDSCGNTQVLECPAGEECVDGTCEVPPPEGYRCLYDNAFQADNWSCRDMPSDMSVADAQQLCEVDSLGPQAKPGTLEQGACLDRGVPYTGSCAYAEDGKDFFEAGNCDPKEVTFSNAWGCDLAGGVFECLM